MNHSRAFTAAPSQTLVRLLALALGDDGLGRSTLDAALRDSRRKVLPEDPEELVDFARAHLATLLLQELGAKRVALLFTQLREEMSALRGYGNGYGASVPPSSAVRSCRDDPRSEPADAPLISDVVPRRASRDTSPSAPFNSSSSRPASQPSFRRINEPRRQVLLIDPDAMRRSNLARTLIHGGCDVIAAATASEVTKTLTESTVHLLIVDLDMNGVESILRAVARLRPDVPFIAVTRHPMAAESMLRAAGMEQYLASPHDVRASDMLERVRHFALEP